MIASSVSNVLAVSACPFCPCDAALPLSAASMRQAGGSAAAGAPHTAAAAPEPCRGFGCVGFGVVFWVHDYETESR